MERQKLESVSQSSTFLDFIRRSAWWWGTVLLAFVSSFLPFWVWNITANGLEWSSFWRIIVTPNSIFDSYLYFQQLSLLKAGINTGSFSWFARLLQGLMWLLPHASIPMVWILSRWFATFLFFWIGAWCIRRVTGASTNCSRWIIICFWFSFLFVIGMRPGVFSWYLPFGLIGLGLVTGIFGAWHERRWAKAIGGSLVALAAFSVYPWFMFYGGVFLVSMFVATLIRQNHGKLFYALIAITSFVIGAYSVFLVSGVLSFHASASLAVYDRNGINFAWFPLISNTVLAIGCWIVLLYSARKRIVAPVNIVMLLAWSWIVLLVVWFSASFVGVDFQSDHFIIVAVMLAWMTVAFFMKSLEHAVDIAETKTDRWISLSISLFASLFLLYILQKALRNIGKFEPYTIHLSIWLALAWAAWFHWFNIRSTSMEKWWMRFRWVLLVMCVSLGSLGVSAVIRRGMTDMHDLGLRIPVILWIQEHTPPNASICADTANARIVGAHVARLVFPNESNLMLREAQSILHRRLITIGSAYDVDAANDAAFFSFLTNGYRLTACAQYAEERRLLERFGMSHDNANRFVGCQEALGAKYEHEVMAAIRVHQVDVQRFRAVCPWVIIPDDHKPFWHLPGSYAEIRVSEDTSIWHVK